MQIHFLDTEEYQFSRREREKIKTTIEDACFEVKQLLPALSDRLNVTVQPSEYVIPETGEGATAVHPDLLNINIDPNADNSMDWIIDNHLRGTFFHEAHHCTRYKEFDNESTLSENAILEGLATTFEREFANYTPLWGDYSGIPVQEWTQELLAHRDEIDFNYQKWFFGTDDGRRWVGYHVGTYIVDRTLENHPEETPATLVHTSADEIVEMADL